MSTKSTDMRKKRWTTEQFVNAVNTSYSYAEVITKLGLKVVK